jgi:hypothetical protein
MANFLITTPNSLALGTDTTDLFVLSTALGVTVNAGAGNDKIDASAANFVNADFQGGAGNDSIYLTAGGAKLLAVTEFAAGGGNDFIAIDQATATNATIVGGGGNDTIQLSGGLFASTEINANLGSDLISASGGTFNDVLFGGGGDNDTINLVSGTYKDSTINGGGGHDKLTFTNSTFNTARIEGDTLGDSQYFGNDTILFDSGTFTLGTINGGQGNDKITVSAVIGTSVTVEGNQGNDSIFVNAFASNAGKVLLGAGAGNDTINVSGALVADFGTIQGGGGVDAINVSAAGGLGGFILGGAEADAIGLGTIASGAALTNTVSGVNVAYASFAESNLAGFDVISATGDASGKAFMVTQSAVDFKVAAFDRANAVSGGTRGDAVFTSTFATNLTARAEALDLALVQGQAVVFGNGSGTNFLFVQAGATGSGTAGDLVVQLKAGFAIASGGLFVANNSALKVVTV